MKKITLLVLSVLLFMGFWMSVFSPPVQAFFGSGTGVSGDPYVVLTADDLNRVRNNLDAHYIQGADIDLSDYASGSGWEPIGTSSAPFIGTFDGNHYRITGLVIDITASANIGLFGYTNQSTIQNVSLENIAIKSSASTVNDLGGLVGRGSGTFTNNYTSGSLETTASFTDSYHVGGLIGSLYDAGSQISNSYSTVRVISNVQEVGGLVGYLDHDTLIEKSYATGNVSGSWHVGGLIGVGVNITDIRNSYATGDVQVSEHAAGGLFGHMQMPVHYTFAAGKVSGGNHMGAFAGTSYGSVNSYWNKTANPDLFSMSYDPESSASDPAVGLTESAMKQQASFDGFDFTNKWGINEGHSYPYLRVFAPVVQVDDLSPTPYQQGSTLMITGEMRDGSIGQAVTVRYEIFDSLDQSIGVGGSKDFTAVTGGYEPYSFSVVLDETNFPGGNYTVNVMAEDSDGKESPVRSLAFAIPSSIYYVKEGGAGNKDGSSWVNAFDSLQAALDKATVEGNEIQIAKGTYYPTKEIDTSDSRTATFQMKNGVSIYGGFTGNNDSETVDSRDWKTNETILSGDLDKDDDPSDTSVNKGDNAYHVFYHPDGINLNNTAVLNGVSIVGGNANDSTAPHSYGGGMYNDNSHPVLKNVTLSDNTADYGGGMYNANSTPILTNITLSGNAATNGGGMYNWSSSPVVSNSIIWGNTSSIANDSNSKPTFTTSLIEGSGGSGGWEDSFGVNVEGNLDVDPQFVVPKNFNTAPTIEGDYRLLPGSPAIPEMMGALGVYKLVIDGFAVLADLSVQKGTAQADLNLPTKVDVTDKVITLPLEVVWNMGAPSFDGDTPGSYLFTGTLTLLDHVTNPGGLSAKVNVVVEPAKYTVIFEDDGVEVAREEVMEVDKPTKPANPTKAGHKFAGWYEEANFTTEWNFDNSVTTDRTLYAKWTKNPSGSVGSGGGGGTNPTYKLTFESNGGSAVASQNPTYNEVMANPTAPSKVGHTFEGWYTEATFMTAWDFEKDSVTKNTTLYAKWTANPPACVVGFTDTATHWAKEDIDAIFCLEIIKGYSDGTFRPNESIKREHVALMFTRAFELTPSRSTISFTDVPSNHIYYDAITEVYRAGIFDGESNDKFNSSAYMTRAQMAKVLVWAFDLAQSETSKNVFPDVSETHWAKDYIAILADHGITFGDNGKFKPGDPVTRAQFVAFMHRALTLSNERLK